DRLDASLSLGTDRPLGQGPEALKSRSGRRLLVRRVRALGLHAGDLVRRAPRAVMEMVGAPQQRGGEERARERGARGHVPGSFAGAPEPATGSSGGGAENGSTAPLRVSSQMPTPRVAMQAHCAGVRLK